MTVHIRGDADSTVELFATRLEEYANAHPSAQIDVYRQNQVSIRVRVIDSGFQGKTRSERHKLVWPILYQLPEDTLNELSILLLITPEERGRSLVDREFDDPIPSRF